MMKKSVKNTILLLSLATMISCAESNKKNTESATSQEDKKILVKTVVAQKQVIDRIHEFTATVESEKTNNIAPNAPVRINKILVEVGDRVASGQKLVQMDATNLAQLELQIANSKKDFERIDELYKVGGVSKANWDAAKMALDLQVTSYNNLLENTQLVAPVSGIITARNYDDGDMYNAAKPVLVIEQIKPVKLLINVSEQYYTKVKKGLKADVKLDVYGDEIFKGVISLIHPTLNAATRTFAVEVKLPNRDERVRPGMFGRVILNFGKEEGIMIKDVAVQKQIGTNEKYAFVINDSIAERRVVTLGIQNGDMIEILSGINEGDEVAITSLSRLDNDKKVTVKND
ncbi:MAG: efflux RND transporter periplasmic adaptor subunit [Prevotellaceae bacterium]|jgi:RND family efflux transporter MFP subunit|nr:efflux RND transporter periplasmic adaptor subunit [Prevotellaceae bacterium]